MFNTNATIGLATIGLATICLARIDPEKIKK